ncbi:MAG: hypothetical protein IKU72_05690 [Oscillospiraceae bacterium]|nr:hypothetical protein [Oscillospiraceae bacterium]
MLGKKENALVYVVGSVGYTALELLWRGYTSWTMTATGGVCFGLLYRLSRKISHLRLWKQCLAGGGVITMVELSAGLMFNRLLKMKVWDYSNQPFHFKGQICLLYSALWCLLCLPVMVLCRRLRRRFEG